MLTKPRTVLAAIATLGLLLGFLIPVAAAQSSGSGGTTPAQCPDGYTLDGDWCTKTVTDVFDATEVVTYECPAGSTGPDALNKCTTTTDEVFDATATTELVCPADYVGPDTSDQCTKTESVIDIVHVTESVEFVCSSDATLVPNSDPAMDPICESDELRIVMEAPTPVETTQCPNGYAGPNVTGVCTRLTVESVPASGDPQLVCPVGTTGPGVSGTCELSRLATEYAGVVATPVVACPLPYLPTSGSNQCIATYPAASEFTCPSGFVLIPALQQGMPPVCEETGVSTPNSIAATVVYSCLAPFAVLDGTNCTQQITGAASLTLDCPTGFNGPVQNLCTRTITETISINAVVVDQPCPAGYLGPDGAGQCIRIVTEVAPSIVTVTDECTDPFVGPTGTGDCIRIETMTVQTAPIERPVFTCPAGYTGPDADWNCTGGTIDVTDVIDATSETVYSCPADSTGPDAANMCTRETTTIEDATRVVTYECPADSTGPDVSNMCSRDTEERVRPLGYGCEVTFYDWSNGGGRLFEINGAETSNLDGDLAAYNDDVESIRVSADCTVTITEGFDGHGSWCETLGEGLHNIVDDELSWFSIPGDGCGSGST